MKELFTYALEKSFGLKTKRLSDPKTPNELKETFDLSLEKSGFKGDVKSLIDGVYENSINTQNPRFLNQLFGGSTEESWLGEVMVSALNTSMATYEIAPLATLMEKELVNILNDVVGFSEVEGIMTPGGSYANMLGIQCARYVKVPDSKEKGLYASKPLRVFVSSAAHYSSEKALGLMGMGTESLVKVETDVDQKICVVDLEKKIKECLNEGCVPLCVVSTAGTTVWGSFDPIEEIDVLCKKYEIWHHVDAAWGGLALWAEQKKVLYKGLEAVDSITIDFHKLLASTLTKGIFLTSKKGVLRGANSGGGTKYIFHNSDEDLTEFDTGTYAIQCGRKVDSLPVWFQWKLGGTEQFNNKAKELYGLTDWFVSELNGKTDEYKLILSPEYMNICFQLLPTDSKIDVGVFNRELRDRLMSRGNFMVNFSSSKKDGAFFRLVLSHWGVTKEILKELLVELQTIKKELEA